jgi:hypothetical protein
MPKSPVGKGSGNDVGGHHFYLKIDVDRITGACIRCQHRRQIGTWPAESQIAFGAAITNDGGLDDD